MPTMLEGTSHEYDEEATMAAIRTIMGDQKRRSSRQIFPELYPATVPNETEM
jgi:hypothetical protein